MFVGFLMFLTLVLPCRFFDLPSVLEASFSISLTEFCTCCSSKGV